MRAAVQQDFLQRANGALIKEGQTLTSETVVAHCAQSMAHFKMPKRVIFVDSLPKNPSGKLLKRELRATLGHA